MWSKKSNKSKQAAKVHSGHNDARKDAKDARFAPKKKPEALDSAPKQAAATAFTTPSAPAAKKVPNTAPRHSSESSDTSLRFLAPPVDIDEFTGEQRVDLWEGMEEPARF